MQRSSGLVLWTSVGMKQGTPPEARCWLCGSLGWEDLMTYQGQQSAGVTSHQLGFGWDLHGICPRWGPSAWEAISCNKQWFPGIRDLRSIFSIHFPEKSSVMKCPAPERNIGLPNRPFCSSLFLKSTGGSPLEPKVWQTLKSLTGGGRITHSQSISRWGSFSPLWMEIFISWNCQPQNPINFVKIR